MLGGFKLYFIFITMLIFAQIVVASENFINFHHEMRNYESDKTQRTPDQVEKNEEVEKLELKNPEIEINVNEVSDNKNE